MAQSTFFPRMTALLFTLVLAVPGGFADSIHNTGGASPDLSITGITLSNYQGYFSEPGTGYTTQGLHDLGQLGLDPGTFLFSPNTMFAYDGTPTFSILSASVDPTKGFIPLNDPTTKLLSFTVPGQNSTSNSPEPHSLYLAFAGIALLSVSAFRRARAR